MDDGSCGRDEDGSRRARTGIRSITEMLVKGVGFGWFVAVVLTMNVVYVLRNRTPRARKAANAMRRFSVRRENASLSR